MIRGGYLLAITIAVVGLPSGSMSTSSFHWVRHQIQNGMFRRVVPEGIYAKTLMECVRKCTNDPSETGRCMAFQFQHGTTPSWNGLLSQLHQPK